MRRADKKYASPYARCPTPGSRHATSDVDEFIKAAEKAKEVMVSTMPIVPGLFVGTSPVRTVEVLGSGSVICRLTK